MNRRPRPLRIAALTILLTATGAHADPRLPAILADHMVLQQGRQVPVWGWADPGEAITVRIEHARADVVTGSDGRWRVSLPPLAAGGPFALVVHGKTSLHLRDVLVGEVWLCAGQSNMNFPLGNADTAATDVPAADHPDLRLFTAKQRTAMEPADDTHGTWQASTPESARDFSAVAYYFGTELHRALRVPVGLVHASWSGTAGEEWVDHAALAADPEFAPILDRWGKIPDAEKAIFRRPEPLRIELDDLALVRADGTTEPVADFDDGTARTRTGRAWSFDWKTAPGAAFALAPAMDRAGWTGEIAGTIEAGDLVALHMSFRPWSQPMDLRPFRALRFRARGEGSFRLHLVQPSIVDWDDYAKAIVATPDWTTVTVTFDELRQAGWGRVMPLTLDAISGLVIEALPARPPSKRPPAGLFNGMIHPLAPYGLRGAVWYQGEGNTARAYQYRRLLPAIVHGWRALWGQGDFPFGIVQLPNYGKARSEPKGSRWAELREAQLMTTLAVPNTGLAVTIDQGDPADVHPRHKVEVGRRLARWALGTSYGEAGERSGPLYESMRVEHDRVRIRFRHVGGGLASPGGEPLAGFEVAGADRVFHWAEARIEGDEVVVASAAVPDPVAVRYAWADAPPATLFNREGFPASPFRSDDWPGKTVAER